MNRQEISLLIGDKKIQVKLMWNPNIETILYHTHGVDFGKELSEFLCDEIKRQITPELIKEALESQTVSNNVEPVFKGLETAYDNNKGVDFSEAP